MPPISKSLTTDNQSIERKTVSSKLYHFLDSANRITDKGGVVPFAPKKNRVNDVTDALEAETHLPSTVCAPAWLREGTDLLPTDFVACRDCLLHFPSRTRFAHTPNFFNYFALPFSYGPRAPAPIKWLSFLKSLWGADTEAIDTLQEMFGYFLTCDTAQQKLFLIVGPKRSGKGTIARVLTELLGQENVAAPTLTGLQSNFGLAPLIGKPLAIISDARLGGRADQKVIVERLLSISGEDSLTIDRKFLPTWTGRLPTRFLILTNELPRLTDASGALASRFITLVLEIMDFWHGY